MNVGKTLFAQIMEFVPWTSFSRIVARYGGDSGVRRLTCSEQFRVMAFAQLTWRESLRDVEASLSANAGKLYAMGFRSAVKRSTLADANESRDWRIWSDLAALLIRRARKLYANDSLGVDLDNTVYALDSSTIDLCLSLFDWAPFRSTKAAVELHTLLDLRGSSNMNANEFIASRALEVLGEVLTPSAGAHVEFKIASRAELERQGVPSSALCLEITESAVMDDMQRALATLAQSRPAEYTLASTIESGIGPLRRPGDPDGFGSVVLFAL